MSVPEGRSQPRVAVVVPVFNRLELLRATVASLKSQTLQDAEFIMVDDRSEDSVWDYLNSLPREDGRFRIMRKSEGVPRGPQASRNLGMDSTNADAVMFLDSDDLLEPGCAEERYAMLADNPRVDMIVGRQAILAEPSGDTRWVNIPKPDQNDIDRFLELTHPIDVPWVNAGVLIRGSALRSAGARFRPEFSWDDVVFHLECLLAGMTAAWMPYDRPPDAYYRHHDGETRGRALLTAWGMRNSASMFQWLHARLMAAGISSEKRRRALARSFYKACVLPAIDAGDFALARELTADAARAGLLLKRDATSLEVYRSGRLALKNFPRLTYYWNRLSDVALLAPFHSAAMSTYNKHPAERAGVRAGPAPYFPVGATATTPAPL